MFVFVPCELRFWCRVLVVVFLFVVSGGPEIAGDCVNRRHFRTVGTTHLQATRVVPTLRNTLCSRGLPTVLVKLGLVDGISFKSIVNGQYVFISLL